MFKYLDNLNSLMWIIYTLYMHLHMINMYSGCIYFKEMLIDSIVCHSAIGSYFLLRELKLEMNCQRKEHPSWLGAALSLVGLVGGMPFSFLDSSLSNFSA